VARVDSEGPVPVTAKLSRKFYETFGDEIANELVDWFNQVDAQYKSELRELADVYYGRFRAELHSEISGLRAEMSALEARLLKWMFIFWAGNVAATLGIVFAALRLSR
jgi:hypothetical protein